MTDLTTTRPVPTREQRMRDARTDFGTYLDRTERDQLDARAATAEQERDDALDDRDQARDKAEKYRVRLIAAEADLLNVRGILSPNGYPQRVPVDLVPTVAPAVRWLADRVDTLTAERDQARAELGAAQELIAELRNNRERDDRAYAAYDTRQANGPDCPTCRDTGLAVVGRQFNGRPVHTDCPDCGIGAEKRDEAEQPPAGLGSPEARAQDEPTALPAWVLELVRGLDRYEVEHPKLFCYIRPGVYEPWDCPAPLLALVPSEVRRLVELPAQVPGERP